MKTLHYSIITVLIVSVAIVIIIEFPIPHSGTIMIIPSKPYQSNATENTIDEKKARDLAEKNVDELKTSYGCHFDSLSGVFATYPNGTSTLEAVRVGYNCNHPYVGSFVIIEDPQLTKVINVTAYPSSRFGNSG